MNNRNRAKNFRGKSSYGGGNSSDNKIKKVRGAKSGLQKKSSQRGFRDSFKSGSYRNSKTGKRRRKMPTFNPSQFVNQNPIELTEKAYICKHTFVDFNLNRTILRTLSNMKITIPSPIQDQIIPEILRGKDVVGLAETGTGKTAAFLLPLIEKTISDKGRKTLILTPTRELAIQINDEFMRLSRGLRLFSTTCVGGVNIRPQISSLKRTNHFVIGTPGRLLDLINRKEIKTENFKTVVLDEADRMLDMGFINDMRKILSATPKDRETLFFSATMDDKTRGLVKDFMKDPVMVSVKKKDVTNSIAQSIVLHREVDKLDILTKLFSDENFRRVIIFGETKHGVEKLSKQLNEYGVRADSIHGNKNHRQRQAALKSFKSGQSRTLVATDVAARGIHVDDVSHVINYDLPQTFADYVHRIGRTGRGEKKGKALTFVPERMNRPRRSLRT